MDMDNVSLHLPGKPYRPPGMNYRLEAFLVRCLQGYKMNTLVAIGMTGTDIRGAAHNGDVVPHCCQTRIEFLTMGLHTALNVRDTPGACH